MVYTCNTNIQEVKSQGRKISVIKNPLNFFLKVLSYFGNNQFLLLW